MQEKAFVLQNKGMNRSLSISKAGESAAYENHNIRIEARENDTLLSVTNERGTHEIDFIGEPVVIHGNAVGWNVLNNHIIVFTCSSKTQAEAKRRELAEAEREADETRNEIDGYKRDKKSLESENEDMSSRVDSLEEQYEDISEKVLTATDDKELADTMTAVSQWTDFSSLIHSLDDSFDEEVTSGLLTSILAQHPDILEEDYPSWSDSFLGHANTVHDILGSMISREEITLDYQLVVQYCGVREILYSASANDLSNEISVINSKIGDNNIEIGQLNEDIGSAQSTLAEQEDVVNELQEELDALTSELDCIYRIEYNGSEFSIEQLFSGDLGFSMEHPIESIVYYESKDIQKVYWLDGEHPLRFMNFVAPKRTVGDNKYYPWQRDDGSYDNTYFDSNRNPKFGVDCKVTKDFSGNTRLNGVVQYLITYYNNHGIETNYVWASDLIYLSPDNRGGSADGNNNVRVNLSITGLDTSFDHFRVYSIFRSSLDGETVAYLVEEAKTSEDEITVSDDGAHLVLQDANHLLYLGSLPVVAGTMTQKDQTLFIGDFHSIGNQDYTEIKNAIADTAFVKDGDENTPESACISFTRCQGESDEDFVIPYPDNTQLYPYENQLKYTSSQIQSFKGGEKYRFALKFQREDGSDTEAFWIGDKENPVYPRIDHDNIERVIAWCAVPLNVLIAAQKAGMKSVQLQIAEATYADRSIKAQGFINPTVFSVWERFNNRTFAMPSWITRPRKSKNAYKHFEPIHNSTDITGEIECNYWREDLGRPAPFYQIKNGEYSREYTTANDAAYDYITIVYFIEKRLDGFMGSPNGVAFSIHVLRFNIADAYKTTAAGIAHAKDVLGGFHFSSEQSGLSESDEESDFDIEDPDDPGTPIISVSRKSSHTASQWHIHTAEALYGYIIDELRNLGVDPTLYPSDKDVEYWEKQATDTKEDFYYLQKNAREGYQEENYFDKVLDQQGTDGLGYSIDRFYASGGAEAAGSENEAYLPSYAYKNIMFVDENILTFDSPELHYGLVSVDEADYKFRIIGIAKIDNQNSDAVIDATSGHLAGKNTNIGDFAKLHIDNKQYSLTTWPLYVENGLNYVPPGTGAQEKEKRSISDYEWGSDIVYYWMRLWGRTGSITGYKDDTETDYSVLRSKTIANLHYSYTTSYVNSNYFIDWQPASLRQYTVEQNSLLGIKIGTNTHTLYSKTYDGTGCVSLGMPWQRKYPILFSSGNPTFGDLDVESNNYLFSSSLVSIGYESTTHAVISLPTNEENTKHIADVLPYIVGIENPTGIQADLNPYRYPVRVAWEVSTDNVNYGYFVNSVPFYFNGNSNISITSSDQYVFIGEIYDDFTNKEDTRYGGTSESDIANNRFVTAGSSYSIDELINEVGEGNIAYVIGNQGDTYFQRWDCLKTQPSSKENANGVIDITSVMLETHINLDGRTDRQRGTSRLASIDTTTFGQINPVYSQQNKFKISRALPEDFSTDTYRSSISWTLPKQDMATIDEWTHITLASTMNLDGDKGTVNALRRFNNSILSFQDTGIAEILFNSRTQLSTTDGVPVEIANSGKVDGKHYLSNNYGCTNKWSIVEGKAGLYFVDNRNKALCLASPSITNISESAGFGPWFRKTNSFVPWNPETFNNIVSFYDKVHSDLYLVKSEETQGGAPVDNACLCYNENLGTFTSFFDYGSVFFMTNIGDRFVSWKDGKLWLNNEGFYCNFYGKQKDFWVTYRVCPEPFSDKLWTNFDYRADFFDILDSSGTEPAVDFGDGLSDLDNSHCKDNETFTNIRVWNEHQDTGTVTPDVKKRFRIWYGIIPRASRTESNKFGLDRIRNPWINLMFKKEVDESSKRMLAELHDIIIKYFE